MTDPKQDRQQPPLWASPSAGASKGSALPAPLGLDKQAGPPTRPATVKKKPSAPMRHSSSRSDGGRGQRSIPPGKGPGRAKLRPSASRMPGAFDNGGLYSQGPQGEEDPASRFVLKKKQTLSKAPVASGSTASRLAPPSRRATTGIADSIKKAFFECRRLTMLVRDNSSQAGFRPSPEQEDVDAEESARKLDVYGIEGQQAASGRAAASDELLLSGTKALVCSRGYMRKKLFDFGHLVSTQVLDASFLGAVLVQKLPPAWLTGREARPGHLLPLPAPLLSHIPRHRVFATDLSLCGRGRVSEGAVDSLMYLPSCNDAAIVESLQQRFLRGLFFTSCDNMLIFVNPLEAQRAVIDDVFNYSTAVRYWTAQVAELPTHPYLFARRAFADAKRQHRNQLVLTLGAFGCGQDRVHHELVKLFIRFAVTMPWTTTEEEVRSAEASRDAAVHLLESLYITHRGELFGGRLMDLFQVEFNAKGDVVGFGFLPNSSNEASQDIVSWQMRQPLKAIPLPNIFYHVMYAIHFKSDDPALKSIGLHPVDVTGLMQYFPPPYMAYEDLHYEKLKELLADLRAIGLSEQQQAEFMRIVSAILFADVVSYKIHNEVDKEATPEQQAQRLMPSAAPRVQRIGKPQARKVEPSLIFGQKNVLTLAGLDIINVLATLLKVDETVLRDLFLGPDVWQVRFLALKLFARLRWWLLGMISQSLRLSAVAEVHNRITLLNAVGLDFRKVGQEWALNQLLHNYTEECFLHLFATWAFTLDQATYLLEGVKPPPAHFTLNDDIVKVFAGPEGVWQVMREEHATRGGEAADDLSEGVPLAAISFVQKILKSMEDTNKILVSRAFSSFDVGALAAQTKQTIHSKYLILYGLQQLDTTLLCSVSCSWSPVLCQFAVVHTSGTLVYDATKFCVSDANAYSVASRLRTLLLNSKMELLRTLVQHEAANDVIPTDCHRISVANRLIQYAKDSLSEGEEAPQTNFIACVSSVEHFVGTDTGGTHAPGHGKYRADMRHRRVATTHESVSQGRGLDALTGSLRHEPQVPPRIRALMAAEAGLDRNSSVLLRGFDAVHVWNQLHNLQILTYCATRYLGMTVRLLYDEFLELYSILCIPSSYEQQTTKVFLNHHNPKAASSFLLRALKFPNTGYQLGKTMVFFRKAAFIVLEKRRIEYLERAVPAVTRIQRVWKTVRERAFVADMRSLCIRVQSHARRILLVREQKELQPLKHLLWGAAVLAGIAYAFRRMGLSEEVVQSIKLKFRNREVYCLRWSAAVCVQSWWRSVMAQKEAAKLRQAVLLEHCSLLVQNAWRCFKAQATILEKITEERIPNRAATVVQRHFRGWRERRKFQELRGLTMAFLSIQRKGAKLYSMRVMLNYRPIIRRTTVMRDMIAVQLDSSVVRIQSFFRMAVIRQQYVNLRNAVLLCQAGALTRLRRGDFLLAKQMVVKIQRWWRSVLLLRGLNTDVALPPPIRMPKKADSVVRRRELVAFELLRPQFLRVQGTFRFERLRQECRFAYPVRLLVNGDARAVYPRTWAQPLQDLLTQTAAAASEQHISYLTECTPQGAPVMFLDIAVGGHHSLVLIGVRQPASGSFATRVRTVIKGGGWQDFTSIPQVYSWGWDDRGQLGAPQRPREQGITCVGPLTFVDRVFRDVVDKHTGHLVQQLVQEVDYTHSICTVVAGLDHSVALTNEGMAFAWGDNSEGQCGLGHRPVSVREPTMISTIRNNGIKLKSIAAGPRHTAAICTDGRALMWGASHFVRLPTVPPDSHSYTPRAIPLDTTQEALQVCCGSGFNVLRTARGSGVYVWGRNDSGQLGQGVDDKKSRDWPTFVALPATPAHPHVVSKVAVGSRFVVVSLVKKSPFLYTWGAISVLDEADSAAGSTGGRSGGGQKASSALAQKGGANPFFKFAGAKAAQAPQQQVKKQQADAGKAADVKAVCKPTRVTHPLWKEEAVLDITASGTEVLVLFESRTVHGYSWLQVIYTQRAAAPVAQEEERMPVQSFFFKKATPKAAVEEPRNEMTLSCAVERLRGEFTLQPGVYSLRHLRPQRMAVCSLHSTGNPVSLSFTWAKAVRLTRQMVEYLSLNEKDPTFSKQYTTASGAPVELPPKLKERLQRKHKEAVELASSLLSSPLVTRESQSRQSALVPPEALTPDPQLLTRMRPFYEMYAGVSSPEHSDSDDEKAER
ncbi:hypothetical protein Efla_003316 [Eimeria flavescens]